VFHGLYAWLNAAYLTGQGLADSVLAGESEQALVELCAAVSSGGAPARSAQPQLPRLDYPVPRRDQLQPLRRYARFEGAHGQMLAGSVEASRGCKHLCAHCPIVPVYRGRFFAVPVDTVLADVRQQVAQGARHVSFGDPDFLNGPGHARRVARALHAEFPGLSFDFTAKVEHLLAQRALLAELREHGCAFVVSAVESLSDEVLRRLKKGHSAADVAELVDVLDATDLPLHPTLVAFTPWTTLTDYRATLEFFWSRGLAPHVPPIQLAIRLLVPPGSALLEDGESARCFGPLDAENFVHPWRHPDPRMDALQQRVEALVAQHEAARAPAARSWHAIRALARAAAGERARDEPLPPPFRPEPPRLSEHWFC
jgi:radical SAM superfamily enzyme YgiQ (UPF0313 family)